MTIHLTAYLPFVPDHPPTHLYLLRTSMIIGDEKSETCRRKDRMRDTRLLTLGNNIVEVGSREDREMIDTLRGTRYKAHMYPGSISGG